MLLSEYKAKTTHRLCFFGRAKVGKTALVSQLARVGHLWWFDLEDGIKTALNKEILPEEYWKNITVFRIPSYQRIPMGVETLLKVVRAAPGKICWEHGKWECPSCKAQNKDMTALDISSFTQNDWLVIDSVTQLSVDANAAVLKSVLGEADEPHKFVLDKETGGKDFKYPMAVTFILDRIFGTLQASNINVAVISHEVMTEQLKDTGHIAGRGENQPNNNVEMTFPAAGSRNFSRNFGRYFDALIHVDVINKRHRANSSTTYDPSIQTGTRMLQNIEAVMGPDGKTPLEPLKAIVKMFEPKK